MIGVHVQTVCGQGDGEEKMIRIIVESSYCGTIGVINEESDPESKAGLRMDMDSKEIGLAWLQRSFANL